jgi:hypothetical protein
MLRGALLVCMVGILVACFACVPGPIPSTTSAPSYSGRVAVCDGTNPIPFLSNLYTLSNYQPNPNIGHKVLPVGSRG